MAGIAVYYLEKEIYASQQMGIEVLKVIHGYGSHGRGGEIKKEVKKYLKDAEKAKKIRFFVSGDSWSNLNENVKLLEENYPSLIIDEDIKNINSGITVVYIKPLDKK